MFVSADQLLKGAALNAVQIAELRFHGAVSVAFPIGLGFHTRTIGESDASIDRRHAHRGALWHDFRCDRTQPEGAGW